MARKILCVAEKPSIAKAVAGHLGGGRFSTRNVPNNPYVKNYDFQFDFGPPWGNCEVTMTSVLGHLTELEFGDDVKDWRYPPPIRLFDARVHTRVSDDKVPIANNISSQARDARALFIWTDCDREGEHIGGEVRSAALKGNSRLEVKRAKFSNIERAHVIQAAKRAVNLDDRQVNAVAARIELDLRIGFAFSRLQCNNLKPLGGALRDAMISYGSCQFPTLGFVVDRYFKVKNFIPEPFWKIAVMHNREDISVNFSWNRHRLFDRAAVTVLFERCLVAKFAKVTKVQEKPTKRLKPLPLTTVELQKMATRFLNMNSQQAMEVAEKLYNQGFISYPRTETDRFDRGMNLRALVEKQTADPRWGQYAQNLVDGGFGQPREGHNDDKAHPPIHPITWVNPSNLDPDACRVYEFVTRRFLACCSEDAQGRATDIDIEYGDEGFHAHGLAVVARNYLDVYPYENWTSTQPMPKFTLGERFEPTQAMMSEGKTTAPGYLTEPELIALMDANGIGTDATMAEHIAKIKNRLYVMTQPRAGGRPAVAGAEAEDAPPTRGRDGARRGGRGRGRGGARGGGVAGEAAGRNRMEEFIPTTLGVALVEGYDELGFDTSLSKPFLRKDMELRMKDICEGRRSKEDVVRESLRQYKRVYIKTEEEIGVLKAVSSDSCPRFHIVLWRSVHLMHSNC
ncbi:MAG: DNA topoisomerase [Claussenomyces sp. TS43310]|nr:MAG: DNA topoisomerase [Claussenomyces sp. TS43310]